MIFDRSIFTAEFYGYVPAPLVVSGKFLRDDGTWQTAGGGGGGSLIIKEEGVTLTSAAASIDFVGAAFTASAVGNDVTLTANPNIVYGNAANTWPATQTFSATTAIVLDWGTGFNYEFEQTANGFALRETASNRFALEFNESTSVGLIRASDGLQSAEYRFNGDTGAHEFYSNGNLALSFDDTFFSPTARIQFSKIQTISTSRILGRTTAGSGDVEQISVGAGLSLSGGSLSSTITQYTNEDAQDAVGGILTNTATITFTYSDATPSISASINAASVSNSLLSNMTANRLKGRTVSTGSPEDLTASQVLDILNTSPLTGPAAYFGYNISDDTTDHSIGFKYRRGTSDRHYGILRQSSNGDKFRWISTPDGSTLNNAYDIGTDGVFNFLQQPTVLGSTIYTEANLNAFTSVAEGLTPASGGGTTNFLRADGTWATPPGGGGGLSDVDVLARAFMRC